MVIAEEELNLDKILDPVVNSLDKLDWRSDAFSEALEKQKTYCKENGIVICYGWSDDLVEFDGAIDAEFDCWNGGQICIDENGKKATSKKYYPISLIFGVNGITWQYKTKIPHRTFNLFDEDDIFCRGIAFLAKDMKRPDMRVSEITFGEVADTLAFVKVKWNGKIVYDDKKIESIANFGAFEDKYYDKKIFEMKIKIVQFHHCEIEVEGEEE